jgi:proteasome lid subunit RPN8/RPN11
VQGRIEIDPEREPVEIPSAIYNELCADAREREPEECCGLVTGDDQVRFGRAHRCANVMTQRHLEDPILHPRDGTQAYHMLETDWERVVREAEASGERVTAVYHSHVGTGAYFSEMDHDFAAQPGFPFPDADHVVLSVVDHQLRASGVFRRDPRTRRFVGHPLVPVFS